jgi:hypothetical protein
VKLVPAVPWRISRRCLAVGPWPVSMWRKAEWHHHLVAAVDTGLTAAHTRRQIRFILPPAWARPICISSSADHGDDANGTSDCPPRPPLWSRSGDSAGGFSGDHEDSLAEEVDVRAAVHLPFKDLDAVDVSFHGAGVPRQGQAGGDSGEVLLDAGDEGVQAGQAGGGGLGEPSGESFAAAAGQDDGEGPDAVVQDVQFGAAAQDGFQLRGGFVVEAVGMAGEPA